MTKKAQAIPEGYHSVTPYMIVGDANAALEFYKKAFNAEELFRMADPRSGKIGHSEIVIGDSHIMIADEFPEMGAVAPKKGERAAITLLLFVEDVDKTFAQAIRAGAEVVRKVETQFYGDRNGVLTDPFGHMWTVSTRVEDLTAEQMNERAAKALGG